MCEWWNVRHYRFFGDFRRYGRLIFFDSEFVAAHRFEQLGDFLGCHTRHLEFVDGAHR